MTISKTVLSFKHTQNVLCFLSLNVMILLYPLNRLVLSFVKTKEASVIVVVNLILEPVVKTVYGFSSIISIWSSSSKSSSSITSFYKENVETPSTLAPALLLFLSFLFKNPSPKLLMLENKLFVFYFNPPPYDLLLFNNLAEPGLKLWSLSNKLESYLNPNSFCTFFFLFSFFIIVSLVYISSLKVILSLSIILWFYIYEKLSVYYYHATLAKNEFLVLRDLFDWSGV